MEARWVRVARASGVCVCARLWEWYDSTSIDDGFRITNASAERSIACTGHGGDARARNQHDGDGGDGDTEGDGKEERTTRTTTGWSDDAS